MIRLSDQTFCVLNRDFDVIEYVSKTVVLYMTSLKKSGFVRCTYLDEVHYLCNSCSEVVRSPVV